MRLVFTKSNVKGHYRIDPRTGRSVYVKPYELDPGVASAVNAYILHQHRKKTEAAKNRKFAGAQTKRGSEYAEVLGKHGYRHAGEHREGTYMQERENFEHSQSSNHSVLLDGQGWEHKHSDSKKVTRSTGEDIESLDRHLSSVHKKTS